MISYYVGKSINVSNSHLLKDGNAMLYISLGIERWYQRYSDCYLRLASKKVTEIDDDLSVILPSICSIDFGIHVFDVHYPLVTIPSNTSTNTFGTLSEVSMVIFQSCPLSLHIL